MEMAKIGEFGTKMDKIGKFWDENGIKMDNIFVKIYKFDE